MVLLFVVGVGLPILGIPRWRHRLSLRVHTLYEALGPVSFKPALAWAKVGENRYPFPAEFEKPLVPRPQYSGVINMSDRVFTAGADTSSEKASQQGVSKGSQEDLRDADAAGDRVEPEFRQGNIEKEALDLLLKSRETIAGLVRGNNPSLRFKTWAAAKMDQGEFWVDLTFVQAFDNAEIHYIWKVNLLSKEISPLSHSARALSKP